MCALTIIELDWNSTMERNLRIYKYLEIRKIIHESKRKSQEELKNILMKYKNVLDDTKGTIHESNN